jgi:hypothetical protein
MISNPALKFQRDYLIQPDAPQTHNDIRQDIWPEIKTTETESNMQDLVEIVYQWDDQLDFEEAHPELASFEADVPEFEFEPPDKRLLFVDLGDQGIHALTSPTAEKYMSALARFTEEPRLSPDYQPQKETDPAPVSGEFEIHAETAPLEARQWAYNQLFLDGHLQKDINSFTLPLSLSDAPIS